MGRHVSKTLTIGDLPVPARNILTVDKPSVLLRVKEFADVRLTLTGSLVNRRLIPVSALAGVSFSPASSIVSTPSTTTVRISRNDESRSQGTILFRIENEPVFVPVYIDLGISLLNTVVVTGSGVLQLPIGTVVVDIESRGGPGRAAYSEDVWRDGRPAEYRTEYPYYWQKINSGPVLSQTGTTVGATSQFTSIIEGGPQSTDIASEATASTPIYGTQRVTFYKGDEVIGVTTERQMWIATADTSRPRQILVRPGTPGYWETVNHPAIAGVTTTATLENTTLTWQGSPVGDTGVPAESMQSKGTLGQVVTPLTYFVAPGAIMTIKYYG